LATVIKIVEISGRNEVFTGTYIAGIQSVLRALEDHSNDNMRKQFAAILYEDKERKGIIGYAKNGVVRIIGENNAFMGCCS